MRALSINTIIPADELINWQVWELAELPFHSGRDPYPDSVVPVSWISGVSSDLMVSPDERSKAGCAFPLEEMSRHEEGLAPFVEGEIPSSTLSYPTAAELETIHHEAWHTGYDAGFAAAQAEGFAEGHAAGLEQGKKEAREKWTECWTSLTTLAESFNEALSQIEGQLSLDILKLSVTLAERLVADHVVHEPNALLPILRDVLAQLPAMLAQGRIKVHPDDLAVARVFLEQETPTTVWQWIEDPTLKPGGCIVETAQLKLDMSLASRLAVLKTALGLEPDYGIE